MKKTPTRDIFTLWGRRIDWKRRVKAVCKPCWELKYCPYGPLVEQFPLKVEHDSRSCRIFGHDCPVFHVAEPLTETKELRRISRNIPRPVQFRVMKRENQICSVCSSNVQDQDAHFDHIIPFSKGGSSDESNVRLLCDACNQKRSNRFEHEFLVRSFVEHTQTHFDLSFLDLLIDVFIFAHDYRETARRLPDAAAIAKEFAEGDVTMFEESMARTVDDFREFFSMKKPEELTTRQMRALRLRWGFSDGQLYSLSDASDKFGEDVREMVVLERSLIARAGWYLKEDKFSRRAWAKK